MSDELRDFTRAGAPIMLGLMGYIGFALAKDDPEITTKRFIGGAITAAFVAWATNVFCVDMLSLPPSTAGMIAAIMGSQGPAGAYLLIKKVNSIFKK